MDESGRPPDHRDFVPTAKSSLHVIAKGGYTDLAYHDVVRLLIRRKWKEYARTRFVLNLILFIVTQAALCFCAITATMTPDPTVYKEPLHIIRAVLELWSVLHIFFTLLLELNKIRKHHLDYFKDQFNWLDLLSSLFLISVIPLRWTQQKAQWYMYSLGFVLWTLRIFTFAPVFRQTGAYAQALWRIFVNDFRQFIVVFAVFLLAFSGAFVLALRGEDSLNLHPETSTFQDILFTGVRILIEGGSVVDYTGPQGYRPLSCFLMVTFLFMCSVVLLNILIAELSDTYHNVQQDAQRDLVLNRARIISRVELNGLFVGKYRQSYYREMDEMPNPRKVLEKWETAQPTETKKYVKDIVDSLESHNINLLTIKNRVSRQEYALCRIQDQMERLMQLVAQTPQRPKTETASRTSRLLSVPRADFPERTPAETRV